MDIVHGIVVMRKDIGPHNTFALVAIPIVHLLHICQVIMRVIGTIGGFGEKDILNLLVMRHTIHAAI